MDIAEYVTLESVIWKADELALSRNLLKEPVTLAKNIFRQYTVFVIRNALGKYDKFVKSVHEARTSGEETKDELVTFDYGDIPPKIVNDIPKCYESITDNKAKQAMLDIHFFYDASVTPRSMFSDEDVEKLKHFFRIFSSGEDITAKYFFDCCSKFSQTCASPASELNKICKHWGGYSIEWCWPDQIEDIEDKPTKHSTSPNLKFLKDSSEIDIEHLSSGQLVLFKIIL